MASWAHSGFNVNAQVRIGADAAIGRENLVRYLIGAPLFDEQDPLRLRRERR
jgi:hypothetical protein